VLAALALVLVSVTVAPVGRTHEDGGAITGAVARVPQRALEPFVLTAKSSADQLTLHARDIERGPLRHLAAVGFALTAAALRVVRTRRRLAPQVSDSTVTHARLRRRGPPAS
jgi:hypothetical protein